MRKVKWGVLGCAAFAKNTAIPAMLLAENVELVGIASRTRDKAEAFSEAFSIPNIYDSYEAMLADPEIEAVYNPLPNGMHPEWTLRTVEAGKHSLTEKPFAARLEEAIAVHEAAQRHGKYVMEAFMWRFHPMHLRARQLVREEAIGPLTLFRTAFTFTIARSPNVRLDPALAGGGLMDVGCYCISEARYFFGAEPTRVYAQADYDPEYSVDMLAGGMLEFPTGRALFDAGFALPYRCDYELVGSEGRIYCPNAILPGDAAELQITLNGETHRETFPGVNPWTLEFAHLSQCILEGTRPDYDTEDAIRQQRVLDAVYRSTHSGLPERI